MSEVFNFSAGPATLPKDVLAKAQAELLDWKDGLSVMEVSHRSADFQDVAERAESTLRSLLKIPASYKVLFLQGGAVGQFSAVPLNLFGRGAVADYFLTGIWSKKAIKEAEKYGEIRIAASSEAQNFLTVPESQDWQLSSDAAYVHYTANETIGGLAFADIPEVGDVPLVCDMSSSILSEPIDVSRFGIIYAGAQKNIGPAGLTISIVREDLLEQAMPIVPAVWHYKTQAEQGSMLNTPPTFAWYLSGLVFEWLLSQGGVEAIAQQNLRKSQKLYSFIDQHDFYTNPIEPKFRSRMNVPFMLADESLNQKFLLKASQAGLKNLAGHRSVGGMRASIYNALPEKGVDRLIDFMSEFAVQFAS